VPTGATADKELPFSGCFRGEGQPLGKINGENLLHALVVVGTELNDL